MTRCPFRGSLVALPTPFRDGAVDGDGLRALIDLHAERATTGIVVCGSTGECLTLNDHERRSVIHAACQDASGRLPVLVGIGMPSTRDTIELARFAAECGADGLLVVAPPYLRPDRRGLSAHFGAVADASALPILLYNHPKRTGTDLKPDLVVELVRGHETIVGIKESSGSLGRARELCEQAVAVFCGEDPLIGETIEQGGRGAISVVGNLLPDLVAELVDCARPGRDLPRAEELTRALTPLVHALALAPNPAPLKAALAELGHGTDEVRAPLVPVESDVRERVRAALGAAKLLPT